MPNNSPPGDSAPLPSTFRKPPSAHLASAFQQPPWNTALPTCSRRLPHGAALLILSLRPTPSRFCRLHFAPAPLKILRDSSAAAASCLSLLVAVSRPTPKAGCLGRSPAPSSPRSPLRASRKFLLKTYSISKIPQSRPSAGFAPSTVSQREYFSF